MNIKLILSAMVLFGLFSFTSRQKKEKPTDTITKALSIYDIEINALDGSPLNLSDFEGKKIMFVNVASKCGYTPQYAGLQELSEKYGDNLVIIGVPCNQFLKQEPGTPEEIAAFCQKNYGVTFQLTEKVKVKGKDKHELYSWLTELKNNGYKDSDVKWNFQKYLVDETGHLIKIFSFKTEPMSEKIFVHLD